MGRAWVRQRASQLQELLRRRQHIQNSQPCKRRVHLSPLETRYQDITSPNQELEKSSKAKELHTFGIRELNLRQVGLSSKEETIYLHRLSMEVRHLLQEDCFTRQQKSRCSGSHSKFCFTSATGKAALTTEEKPLLFYMFSHMPILHLNLGQRHNLSYYERT